MKLFDKRWKLALSGVIFGLVAVVLAIYGNPKNMAICVACFVRDMAGGLKLHSAETVQYVRPEIIGFVLGSFIISVATKEFKATAGSSPIIRFVLGFIMMLGALVFLGCPLRMIIRMSAGDLNAYVGLLGFAAGIATGCVFLKRGFSLGRAYEVKATNGVVLPIIMIIIFVLSVCTSLFAASEKGPGSMHAPVAIALIGALILGMVAQRNRLCFAGSIRDIILMKNFDLISIIGGLFVVMLVYNIVAGNFHLSFTGQPIAHSQHIWNFLGMYAVGFAAVLAGGCPYRQLILAGQGNTDSAVTFIGMLIGAAFAHNFGLAGAAAAAATDTTEAVLGGPGINGKIALVAAIVVLFIIAFTNCRKRRAAK
jgi:YedE family putative selenium metabolism protein